MCFERVEEGGVVTPPCLAQGPRGSTQGQSVTAVDLPSCLFLLIVSTKNCCKKKADFICLICYVDEREKIKEEMKERR